MNNKTAIRSTQEVTETLGLQNMIAQELENRKLITEYITSQLKEGTDYGKIHIVRREKCPEPWSCKNQYHFSKPSLFKPGSEKFTSLFQLTVTFQKDADSWEMAGKKSGLFCYVAKLVTRDGRELAEGRGACDITEKNSMNEAIKIAQKRAQTDAILRYGALSDFFTQDLEDMPEVTKAAQPTPVKALPVDTLRKISPAQVGRLKALLSSLTFTGDEKQAMIVEIIGRNVSGMNELTHDEAAKVIESLTADKESYEAIGKEVK